MSTRARICLLAVLLMISFAPVLSPRMPNVSVAPRSFAASGSSWSVVPSPSPGKHYNGLVSVSAVTANDIWAVGCVDTCSHNLAEHWNGSRWRLITTPEVAGTYTNELNGVAAVAPDDVWAVGAYSEDS